MSGFALQVLGNLTVRWRGGAVPLPASKKTRALLGYLALSQGPHGRGELCDLLWDGPADPRGALRWSLSRLRAVLERDGQKRILADRESVSLTSNGVDLDLAHCPVGTRRRSGECSNCRARTCSRGLSWGAARRGSTWGCPSASMRGACSSETLRERCVSPSFAN